MNKGKLLSESSEKPKKDDLRKKMDKLLKEGKIVRRGTGSAIKSETTEPLASEGEGFRKDSDSDLSIPTYTATATPTPTPTPTTPPTFSFIGEDIEVIKIEELLKTATGSLIELLEAGDGKFFEIYQRERNMGRGKPETRVAMVEVSPRESEIKVSIAEQEYLVLQEMIDRFLREIGRLESEKLLECTQKVMERMPDQQKEKVGNIQRFSQGLADLVAEHVLPDTKEGPSSYSSVRRQVEAFIERLIPAVLRLQQLKEAFVEAREKREQAQSDFRSIVGQIKSFADLYESARKKSSVNKDQDLPLYLRRFNHKGEREIDYTTLLEAFPINTGSEFGAKPE